MNKEIHALVCRSEFGTAGQKQFWLMAARYSNNLGEFWIATSQVKVEIQRGRSSKLEDTAIGLAVGLIEAIGKHGKVPRYRFVLSRLRSLANGEVKFVMRDVATLERPGQFKAGKNQNRTRKAWRLVEVESTSGRAASAKLTTVQTTPHAHPISPEAGLKSSRIRTQVKMDVEDRNLPPPQKAARVLDTSLSEWEDYQVEIKIMTEDPDTAHVAEFIELVKNDLGPPKRFSSGVFGRLVEVLKPFTRDVLKQLANQQINNRWSCLEPHLALAGIARKLKDQGAAPVETETRPTVGPKRQAARAGLEELDRAAMKALPYSAASAYFQLEFDGVEDGVARFRGHPFWVSQIDREHRQRFHYLVVRCVTGAQQVEVKEDKTCQLQVA